MDYDEAYAASPMYRASLKTFREELGQVSECRNGDWLHRSIACRLISEWRGRTLLDVGAGNGVLMALARKAGYEVAGVDVSRASRQFIESQIPGALAYATLEEAGRGFSVVTALEILEHVEDPLAFLKALSSRVDRGGLLVLSCPNLERPYWRYGGRGFEREHWRLGGAGDTAPHHLTRFTRGGLRRLLDRAGFSSAFVGHTPLDAVQLLISGLGTRPSFTARVAGFTIRLPFTLLKPYLTREVSIPLFETDETLGYGLMALAGGPEVDTGRLESMFAAARKDVLDRYLRYLDSDLLSKLWANRRFIWDNLRFLPRMLRGG